MNKVLNKAIEDMANDSETTADLMRAVAIRQFEYEWQRMEDALATLAQQAEQLRVALASDDDAIAWTSLRSFVNHAGYSNTLTTAVAEVVAHASLAVAYADTAVS